MKKLFILVLAIIGIVSCNNDSMNIDNIELHQVETIKLGDDSDRVYFWNNGTKVNITPNYDKFYIVSSAVDGGSVNYVRRSLSYLSINEESKKNLEIDFEEFIVQNVSRTNIQNVAEVKYKVPYYTLDDGTEFCVTDIFSVYLKNINDLPILKKIANDNNVLVLGESSYNPLCYYLKCDISSKGNAMQMSNYFYETGKFQMSAPEMILNIEPAIIPNDPLFTSQWALSNVNGVDINYPYMLDYNFNNIENITIAIIDSGIDVTHPDLNLNIKKSFDAHTGSVGQVYRGPHGTKCCGVIAANTNNNVGVAGVADGVGIMPISVLFKDYATENEEPSTSNAYANAIRYAYQNGADVISCSWSSKISMGADVNAAISEALNQGRNGLGCIMVFSSGNNGMSNCRYPSIDNPNVITVGAIDTVGILTSFSNYGNELDLVAPGLDIYTTINGGGYNKVNGTSFSCPYVAAVASLLLSYKPELLYTEVAELMEDTAEKNSQYTFTYNSAKSDLWNEYVGCGLVNLEGALNAIGITEYNNKTINGNSSVVGNNVYCRDVVVNLGASLIIDIADKCEINSSFIVQAGGELIIQ